MSVPNTLEEENEKVSKLCIVSKNTKSHCSIPHCHLISVKQQSLGVYGHVNVWIFWRHIPLGWIVGKDFCEALVVIINIPYE
jgi:hypothetical protein